MVVAKAIMVLKLEQRFYTLPGSVWITLGPDGKKEGDEICRTLGAFELEAEIKGGLEISSGNPAQISGQNWITDLTVRFEEDTL
jgi:hypothetical protein